MFCHSSSETITEDKDSEIIRVALIGNPNVGKTVIFNNFTGAKQHVGNWPGVTVEKKVGKLIHKGIEMQIVDLPGTYSLSARSIDEMVARDYIVNEKPDVVVDIVDATNLERNLYLTILLLEINANLVIALNMWDAVEASGAKIDIKLLSERLGVPIIPTVATTEEGMEELKDAIFKAVKNKGVFNGKIIKFRPEIEVKIKKVEEILKKYHDADHQELIHQYNETFLHEKKQHQRKMHPYKFKRRRKFKHYYKKRKRHLFCHKQLIYNYPLRWVAIKVLEKDKVILTHLREIGALNEVLKVLE